MIKKIIVIGDILRYLDGQSNNTAWIFPILDYEISQITDIPVVCFHKELSKNFVQKFYQKLGIDKQNENSWIETNTKSNTKETLNLIEQNFKDSFIVAFELCSILQEGFDALKIPYIKLMSHPIRYLDDIFWGITSSEKNIFNALKKYQIDTNLWKLKASIMKAETARKKIDIKPNSCVFFAQTNMDCSLLKGNKLVSFFDYKNRFIELYNQYDHLYYKIHPCAKNQKVVDFISTLPKASILYPNDISTYDLLATDRVKKYVSISSGSLYEAKYFGKEVEYFLHQPFMFVNDYKNDEIYDYKNTFIPVYKNYWQPSFWADILQDYIKIKKPIPKDITEPFHNTFRKIINMTWAYQDYSSVLVDMEKSFIRTEICHLWDTVNKLNEKEHKKTKLYRFFHLYWLRGKK